MNDVRDDWPRGGSILYFVSDTSDAKFFARSAAMKAAGVGVISVGFGRKRYDTGQAIHWEHLDLGSIEDRHYLNRLVPLVRGIWRFRRLVGTLRDRQESIVLVARNLDMAIMALICRKLYGLQVPFIYEVLDIQRIMVTGGLIGWFARWVEKRVLREVVCLWVSSRRFMSAYFEPFQGFGGMWLLLENKLTQTAPVRRPALPDNRWVIGWFGTLRCRRSLDVLCRLAEALGSKLEVQLRGYPTATGLAPFERRIAPHPNMVFSGSYDPLDLPDMMAGIHFAWAFDYSDAWGNSAWLLPNRLYEACYYERPLLADGNHETGRKVVAEGLGWTVTGDIFQGLYELLETLDQGDWERKRAHIAKMDKCRFAVCGDMVALLRNALKN